MSRSIRDQAYAENVTIAGNLLNVGALVIRAAGVQAELGGSSASKFKDTDVVGLLAARIANRKKL